MHSSTLGPSNFTLFLGATPGLSKRIGVAEHFLMSKVHISLVWKTFNTQHCYFFVVVVRHPTSSLGDSFALVLCVAITQGLTTFL